MQLAVCVSGKFELTKDIPVFLQNGVKMVTINDYQFFLNASEKKLLKAKKTFRATGIKIHSVHAPIGNGDNLVASEKEVREQAVRRCQKLIHNLSIANIGIMVFHIGSIENKRHQSSAFSMAMESLYRLVEWAEKYKVILALENEPPQPPDVFPHTFCFNSRTLLGFLEKVNSPYLKACYDTGHAHIGERKGKEKIKEAVKNLGNWIATMHIQDNDGAGDFHLQPGYGTINWVDFVTALQDINYSYPVTIEANPWGGAPLRRMLNEVRALLKDAGTDISTRLTLNPNRDWLNKFSLKWRTEKVGDVMIRCRKCGHYVVWGPKGGSCVCKERKW